MYEEKEYTISRVDIPSMLNPIRIMPPPIVNHLRGSGKAAEYNSDTADSLLEVPTDKSLTLSVERLGYTGDMGKKTKKKKMKKKKDKTFVESQSEDELNSTTMFTINNNAKLNPDGSLDYTDGFRTLPLTPTSLRRSYERKEDIPPLDFGGLRGSSESVSFQPYSATFRSTDTVRTDRLLPALREEKMKTTLKPVLDTEL